MSKAFYRRLWAELPTLDCQQKCQAFCGPIAMSREEWERIQAHLGRRPVGDPETLVCPMLSADGRCTVYALRPMICRVWGLTPRLRCPHGCVPSRWLTDHETYTFLLRSGAYGEPMEKPEAEALVGELLASPQQRAILDAYASMGSVPPKLNQPRVQPFSPVKPALFRRK